MRAPLTEDAMRARLSQTELMIGAYVGSGRNVQAMTRGWRPRAGADEDDDDSWTKAIVGAQGEVSVAKALYIYYEPIIGDPDAPDVGPYHVRTNNSRKWDDTCLRKGRDKPGNLYISVLSFCPDFELIGWIMGYEGMLDKWLREGDPKRPPCFYVPRKELHKMAELPDIVPELPKVAAE